MKKKLLQHNLINNIRNCALRLDMRFRKKYVQEQVFRIMFRSLPMAFHTILRFLHIIFFASWFGTVMASLFVLKALESKLTGNDVYNTEFAALLQRFLKLETKVADVAVIGVIFSGIMLAAFFHGWTIWVFVKSFLIVLQVTLTIGYIMHSVRTITYPCSKREYANWYRLFGISLTMFALILIVTFFIL